MLINDLEEYAVVNDIPIVTKEGFVLIEELIVENEVLHILEIGSAIGYSAIRMALINENIHVTTIERDLERYSIAKQNIANFNLDNRIDILNIDAFDFSTDNTYDMIFIDGAKSQYTKWFIMYSEFLQENGIIICDNLDFHGHVQNYDKIETRNLRQLVTKIIKFVKFLESHEEFKTDFYKIGDGMSVSRKVKK